MRLEKWALLVESIGTLAIIVSLLFVAFEIRENTNATYAASYDTLAASSIDWRMRIAENPKMREDWRALTNRQSSDGVTDVAGKTTAYVMGALLLIYERAYFAREYGRLGDREWGRYQRTMCDVLPSFARDMVLETNYTVEFWQYLQDCQDEQ